MGQSFLLTTSSRLAPARAAADAAASSRFSGRPLVTSPVRRRPMPAGGTAGRAAFSGTPAASRTRRASPAAARIRPGGRCRRCGPAQVARAGQRVRPALLPRQGCDARSGRAPARPVYPGAERFQPLRLGVHEPAPGLDRNRSPAADGDVEVQPVLERLLLRDHLEPDPRAPPGRIDDAGQGRGRARPRSRRRRASSRPSRHSHPAAARIRSQARPPRTARAVPDPRSRSPAET